MIENVRPIGQLLRNAQTADPQKIVETLELSLAEYGGRDAVLLLVDYDHRQLRPHPDILPHGEKPEIAEIEGSMAGRAYLTGQVTSVEREDGWHCWIPVTERAERLGVLALTMERWDDEVEAVCVEVGIAAAHLVVSATKYTDKLTLLRRRRDMSLAAEMQWALLPPLSAKLDGTSVAGLLEPAYDVGGDCFDYSINGNILDFAIFDAMGHGLSSAILGTLAVSAYRSARRLTEHVSLTEVLTKIDESIFDQYHGDAFVTALIGRLELDSGKVTWISAGHPHAVHLRNHSAVTETKVEPLHPLGVRSIHNDLLATEPEKIQLEPGDSLLLYTDGVVDARDTSGEFFGREKLVDFLGRSADSGLEPGEVLRRLVQSVLAIQEEHLRDDASMLYIHWSGL